MLKRTIISFIVKIIAASMLHISELITTISKEGNVSMFSNTNEFLCVCDTGNCQLVT